MRFFLNQTEIIIIKLISYETNLLYLLFETFLTKTKQHISNFNKMSYSIKHDNNHIFLTNINAKIKITIKKIILIFKK